LSYLALLYDNLDRFADAEPLYKRTLAIYEQGLGPDHAAVAVVPNNLAVLYDKQGHYADAEPLDRRALAIREKALGPEHPDVATSMGKQSTKARRFGDRLSPTGSIPTTDQRVPEPTHWKVTGRGHPFSKDEQY
jgi:tetratricopeptide (TPR) repeat protein